MKTTREENHLFRKPRCFIARAIIVAGFLLGDLSGLAQGLPTGTNSAPAYTPLDSWSFYYDHTNWTSDLGYAPVSFTNLAFSQLGNFASLVVDTNVPAWLQYHVYENDGSTNFSPSAGTVMFWFAPGSWSGTNAGGTGPGEYGRLFEAGAFTTNSSLGWWSIYVDPAGANLYFSTQTNDLSGYVYTYLAAPISWTTNYFHFIALTYSATNTALYLDGVLATNGPPLAVYPGPNALTNGFFIGSDSSGVYQAHGLFNSITTFNVPLDAGTIQLIFASDYIYYMMNPLNTAMETLFSASSSPDFTGTTYSAITGAGNLQWVGSVTPIYEANANQVWITNVTATATNGGTENVTFTIQGGQPGYYYDVFATGALESPLANALWFWMGQGNSGNTYTLPITSHNAFLILGTPQDSNGDGVTDAFSRLVANIDPNTAQSDAYGVPYAWYVQNGLNVLSALLDPDQDGLVNYREYLYGTRPQVSEGFAVWATTGSYSSIP
jgi:hypothetical protein